VADFAGLRVVSFESRRATEMASLVARHGGIALTAPTIREVTLAGGAPEALDLARSLRSGDVDVLVLMTGVGTRALVQAIAAEMPPAELAAVLSSGQVTVVARGPKPAAALRELGVKSFASVPEPNTWREVLAVLESASLVSGRRVAVQEYGEPSKELHDALTQRGAKMVSVPVYRWSLPEDTKPLRAALHELAGGRVDVALFTSRAQVEHALAVAREEGIEPEVRAALCRAVVASIGPVCSETLRAEGFTVDLEPSHPKMGILVKECAERATELARTKRNAPSHQR
jgi:uroporphyrinogen-III synthase